MGLVQILSDQTGSGKSNMAASKPEVHISPLPGEMATNFQQLFMAMFWGSGYASRPPRNLPEVWIFEESKMAAFNRKQILHNVWLSMYARQELNSNGYTHVLGPGNTTRQLRRLPDVQISCELNMASVNCKLICAIFDSSQIHASSSLRSSLVVLPDPKTWVYSRWNFISIVHTC